MYKALYLFLFKTRYVKSATSSMSLSENQRKECPLELILLTKTCYYGIQRFSCVNMHVHLTMCTLNDYIISVMVLIYF